MKNEYKKPEAYKQAEKKVKNIRGFYINLFIYVITMTILLYINLSYSTDVYWSWFSALVWGMAMVIYGLTVYGYMPFMIRNWEERKLSELIDKENGDNKAVTSAQVSLSIQMQHNRIQKRVRALRNFYRHLAACVLVGIVLLLLFVVAIKSGYDFLLYSIYGTALGWAIGLVVHIFIVFGIPLVMGKKWEEKKIKTVMEKEGHMEATPYKD